MKGLLFLTLFISANTLADLHSMILEKEELAVNPNQDSFQDKTKDALLSVPEIEERAEYLTYKIKNLTFGEYSENVLFIAPIVTGNIELKVDKFQIYYNQVKNKGGLKYKLSF